MVKIVNNIPFKCTQQWEVRKSLRIFRMEGVEETDPKYQTFACRPRSWATSAKTDRQQDHASNIKEIWGHPH